MENLSGAAAAAAKLAGEKIAKSTQKFSKDIVESKESNRDKQEAPSEKSIKEPKEESKELKEKAIIETEKFKRLKEEVNAKIQKDYHSRLICLETWKLEKAHININKRREKLGMEWKTHLTKEDYRDYIYDDILFPEVKYIRDKIEIAPMWDQRKVQEAYDKIFSSDYIYLEEGQNILRGYILAVQKITNIGPEWDRNAAQKMYEAYFKLLAEKSAWAIIRETDTPTDNTGAVLRACSFLKEITGFKFELNGELVQKIYHDILDKWTSGSVFDTRFNSQKYIENRVPEIIKKRIQTVDEVASIKPEWDYNKIQVIYSELVSNDNYYLIEVVRDITNIKPDILNK